MAGHLGDVRCTVEKQEVVRIDKERNLILIKGGVPGAARGYVMIKPAFKVRGEKHGA